MTNPPPLREYHILGCTVYEIRPRYFHVTHMGRFLGTINRQHATGTEPEETYLRQGVECLLESKHQTVVFENQGVVDGVINRWMPQQVTPGLYLLTTPFGRELVARVWSSDHLQEDLLVTPLEKRTECTPIGKYLQQGWKFSRITD